MYCIINKCMNFQVTNKISFSKTVRMMDEAISINPSFVKKINCEDDGITIGQGSSKSSYPV